MVSNLETNGIFYEEEETPVLVKTLEFLEEQADGCYAMPYKFGNIKDVFDLKEHGYITDLELIGKREIQRQPYEDDNGNLIYYDDTINYYYFKVIVEKEELNMFVINAVNDALNTEKHDSDGIESIKHIDGKFILLCRVFLGQHI